MQPFAEDSIHLHEINKGRIQAVLPLFLLPSLTFVYFAVKFLILVLYYMQFSSVHVTIPNRAEACRPLVNRASSVQFGSVWFSLGSARYVLTCQTDGTEPCQHGFYCHCVHTTVWVTKSSRFYFIKTVFIRATETERLGHGTVHSTVNLSYFIVANNLVAHLQYRKGATKLLATMKQLKLQSTKS